MKRIDGTALPNLVNHHKRESHGNLCIQLTSLMKARVTKFNWPMTLVFINEDNIDAFYDGTGFAP